MALRVRFQYTAGASLGYSIERLADGLFFDFADNTFKPTPTTAVVALPADTGNFVGRYKVTLSTPAAQFADGEYCLTIHDMASANAVVAELSATICNGDDAPVFPTAGTTTGGVPTLGRRSCPAPTPRGRPGRSSPPTSTRR